MNEYRNNMEKLNALKAGLSNKEHELLNKLRAIRSKNRISEDSGQIEPQQKLTFGQRIADGVAATMGSWKFIIIQSFSLFLWVILNITAYMQHWDPYPFILLNLALSFQAAYAAPFIMMSQNRQQDVDRKNAFDDYQINIKAELEIELLHHKIDQLREMEILALAKAVENLTKKLDAETARRAKTKVKNSEK